MKLPVRNTHSVRLSVRITAPEFRKDTETGVRLPLLSWADDSSNHHRSLCTKELFLAAAGNNEVGEFPDGMDRIKYHNFYIHFDKEGFEKDKEGFAIGIDVVPSRQFGGKVVPASQVGVTTLKLQWATDGSGVVRVLQHPVNTRPELIRKVIASLDAMGGKSLKVGMMPMVGNAAKIVSLNDGVVEIKLSARASRESVHGSMLDEVN